MASWMLMMAYGCSRWRNQRRCIWRHLIIFDIAANYTTYSSQPIALLPPSMMQLTALQMAPLMASKRAIPMA